ncbi:BrnT family toxin [candidate division KSB1 bacterium]|nr:BrnT family toxin [candidate division KSB1 bacterium]NIR68836.1 BrnT family toxin [candidate division KSB1 bacterium]NIS27200.1 BrnT family toxin [candidate division KSB1 bacterium]NIT74085.1 BrnT family toxin [candidate division KSB1 bacterium]NIU27934.1 BrnT family toxin [candidate division KSB1 bacterium]
MKFEWDEAKRLSNLENHGLDFEDAHFVFNEKAYVVEDTRKDYGETRYILIGPLFRRLVVIVFTVRQDVIRIISMRKANQREQKQYVRKRSKTNR